MSNNDDALFASILAAEDLVRTNWALAAMGSDLATRDRAERINLPKAKAALFAMIDNMTPEQVAAFGAYRRAHKGLTH
jgi:hypothetical protein